MSGANTLSGSTGLVGLSAREMQEQDARRAREMWELERRNRYDRESPTKRERFALAALTGLCASQSARGRADEIAMLAVHIADATIAKLERTEDRK